MASRLFQRGGVLTLQKDVVILEGSVAIGATGAVGDITGSGILSVSRSSAGVYSIVLQDKYNRFLAASFDTEHATGSGIASIQVSNSAIQTAVAAGSAITINCFDFAGSVADPASATVLRIMICLRNSSIKGQGE